MFWRNFALCILSLGAVKALFENPFYLLASIGVSVLYGVYKWGEHGFVDPVSDGG